MSYTDHSSVLSDIFVSENCIWKYNHNLFVYVYFNTAYVLREISFSSRGVVELIKMLIHCGLCLLLNREVLYVLNIIIR